MNLQLLYWYILSLSKNKNMFYKKKESKTKQNDQKRRKKKSGGSRISKPTNKNNSCTQFACEGFGLRPIYNSYVKERKLLTKNLNLGPVYMEWGTPV